MRCTHKLTKSSMSLHVISAFVDSRLESIEQFLNNFANQSNETNMNNLESDDEAVDTPLVSPFPYSYNDSDDNEVLNELSEYKNTGTLCRERIINSFDGDVLAFDGMIGFRKLYLMRRSLEVLRKFHWMILGGWFNQLLHVSSPLLSKPGEW
ncbi:hypothetical protein Tco_0726630 [Tanacetum coccineum]|uniref:Uncharacterized protein n=1 Tax=Tanacetum coccineum TaxID=301880 RepID=A0ABQ4YG41_9ASTR